MRLPVQTTLALMCSLLAGQGRAAAPDDTYRAAGFSAAQAVAPETLDSYRGGFTTPSGLAVSIGIERIVTIDGNVAARSQLQLGDLGRLASGASVPPPQAAAQLNLIQNGAGNLVGQLGPSVLGGTIVQNSLNNQIIHQATVINASVNAHGMLQSMNFQSTLSNALTNAVTGR
jgi:hypothetical protein